VSTTPYRPTPLDHWLENPLSGCPTFVGELAYRADPEWIDARRRYMSDWPELTDADCTSRRIEAAYDMERVQRRYAPVGGGADAKAA
jgi:hypothetical protein